MSSELTPEEKAYFESGGQKTEGLVPETPATPEPAAVAVPEPAPSSPSTPEPAVAADPIEPGEEEVAAPDGKTKRRVVDSRALKEERRKRQDIEAELRQERELRARVDERLNMLSAAMSQPDPATAPATTEPEAEIDPEQDIFGAYRQQQKRMADLQKAFDTLQSGQQEMRQQTEDERQTGAMISSYRQDAATFSQQTADFTDAYNFLLTKRGEQLRALGYDDTSIRSTLYNEEMNLATRALGMKQSPSAHIYALAQSMGYAKAAPAAQTTTVTAQATPPAAPVAVPSVTAEIDRIKAGQSSSKSLSSGGGAAGEELSLELLANMDMKEFAAFMDKPGNRERVEEALGRRAA